VSVDALHVRLIWLQLIATAFTPVGIEGAVESEVTVEVFVLVGVFGTDVLVGVRVGVLVAVRVGVFVGRDHVVAQSTFEYAE
jgi:hypothetical protein